MTRERQEQEAKARFAVPRKILIVIGTFALCFSALMFVLASLELITYPAFLTLGQSWIRSLASIAVIGCLALAIGHWDE